MRKLLLLLALGALLPLGCAEEPPIEEAILISAPESYLGASVVLNGKELGKFAHLQGHGSLWETILKQVYGDDPTFHLVATIVSLKGQGLNPALHEIEVRAPGGRVVRGQVAYPPAAEIDQYFVQGPKLEKIGGSAPPKPTE